MQKPIENRVAKSGLMTCNPQDFLPAKSIQELDLKQFLFRELLLKEKDFRTAMKEHDWKQYAGSQLAVFCSNDAIIPHWAFMLIASHASNETHLHFGTPSEVRKKILLGNIHGLDVSNYEGQRVVLKGCAHPEIDSEVYLELTKLLQPVVKSLMYGEACSTVPVFKKSNK